MLKTKIDTPNTNGESNNTLNTNVESKKRKILKYANKVIKVASDMADIAVQIKSKPSILTATTVAAKAWNSIQNNLSASIDDYFVGWRYYALPGINMFVFNSLDKHGMLKLELNTNEGKVLISDLYGVKLGWAVNSYGGIGYPYTRHTREEVYASIGRFMWEVMGTSIKVKLDSNGDLSFTSDISTSLFSQTARDIYEKQSKFIKAGYFRSILLYGVPGTGKSHIIRQIAHNCGGYSLRIKSKELEALGGISFVINILRPNAVLIDDLDRMSSSSAILDEFDEVKRNTKMFLATVNDITKLDPAVLRPDRFDDVIEISSLDDVVIDGLLDGVSPELANRMKKLPVAYIEEFRKDREVLGDEQAVMYAEQLCERNRMVSELIER